MHIYHFHFKILFIEMRRRKDIFTIVIVLNKAKSNGMAIIIAIIRLKSIAIRDLIFKTYIAKKIKIMFRFII